MWSYAQVLPSHNISHAWPLQLSHRRWTKRKETGIGQIVTLLLSGTRSKSRANISASVIGNNTSCYTLSLMTHTHIHSVVKIASFHAIMPQTHSCWSSHFGKSRKSSTVIIRKKCVPSSKLISSYWSLKLRECESCINSVHHSHHSQFALMKHA